MRHVESESEGGIEKPTGQWDIEGRDNNDTVGRQPSIWPDKNSTSASDHLEAEVAFDVARVPVALVDTRVTNDGEVAIGRDGKGRIHDWAEQVVLGVEVPLCGTPNTKDVPSKQARRQGA